MSFFWRKNLVRQFLYGISLSMGAFCVSGLVLKYKVSLMFCLLQAVNSMMTRGKRGRVVVRRDQTC
jgi:hypothetical protein